jgi:hypothetical protein
MASWSTVSAINSKTQAPVLPEPGLLLFESRQEKGGGFGQPPFLL